MYTNLAAWPSRAIQLVERWLREPDYPRSIELLDGLLPGKTFEQIRSLVLGIRPDLQAKAASLIEDVATQYPRTLLGVPVMVYLSGRTAALIPLPFPSANRGQFPGGYRFLGWLDFQSELLADPWVTRKAMQFFARANTPQALLAVFRREDPSTDCTVAPSSAWWAELFRPLSGELQFLSGTLAPLLGAIETALTASYALEGAQASSDGVFARDLVLTAEQARDFSNLRL